VLSFAVGGSPQARIDRVLREERGYTYGIRAGFRPRSRGGLFTALGSVRGEVTAEAVGALLEILDLQGADLTDAEIAHAARFQARTAPGRYATCEAVAGEAVSLAMDGLEVDFVTRTLHQVRTLDPSVARQAWDRHRGAPWTVVLVGDAQHADSVRALGRGRVDVVAQPREPSSSPIRASEAGSPT
jgi:predicted Zn-dependent peptidase